jgi:hypothetical protein
VADLARQIAGIHGDLQLAMAIAEAEVDLRRVQQVRRSMIESAFDRPSSKNPLKEAVLAYRAAVFSTLGQERRAAAARRQIAQLQWPPTPNTSPEREAAALSLVTGQLARLERYERRAVARRKSAMRAFDDDLSRKLKSSRPPAPCPSPPLATADALH